MDEIDSSEFRLEPAQNQRELRILLVEDDPLDVRIIQRACADSGLESALVVAHSGPEALGMLKRLRPLKPQFILLDLHMPGMSGLEVLREVKNDPTLRLFPVVVFTTSNDPRERQESYALGAAGFLVKPLSYDELLFALETLVRYFTLVEPPWER